MYELVKYPLTFKLTSFVVFMRNFVDDYSGEHSNNIECYWSGMKKDFHQMGLPIKNSVWMRYYLYNYQWRHNRRSEGMTEDEITMSVFELLVS